MNCHSLTISFVFHGEISSGQILLSVTRVPFIKAKHLLATISSQRIDLPDALATSESPQRPEDENRISLRL